MEFLSIIFAAMAGCFFLIMLVLSIGIMKLKAESHGKSISESQLKHRSSKVVMFGFLGIMFIGLALLIQ